MKLPAKMRYVDHGQGGGPEVMRVVEGELPETGPHDVLIRIEFARGESA
jgi:NADPH:quinone reductase